MIHFERATKQNVIDVLCHPSIWPKITDDFAPEKERFNPGNKCYIAAFDDSILMGIFLFENFNSSTVIIHAAFLPSTWGSKACVIGKQIFDWFFNTFGGTKILGFIPEFNHKMIAFSKKCGMTEEGRITHSFQKNGKLWDQIIVGYNRR